MENTRKRMYATKKNAKEFMHEKERNLNISNAQIFDLINNEFSILSSYTMNKNPKI